MADLWFFVWFILAFSVCVGGLSEPVYIICVEHGWFDPIIHVSLHRASLWRSNRQAALIACISVAFFSKQVQTGIPASFFLQHGLRALCAATDFDKINLSYCIVKGLSGGKKKWIDLYIRLFQLATAVKLVVLKIIWQLMQLTSYIERWHSRLISCFIDMKVVSCYFCVFYASLSIFFFKQNWWWRSCM